MMAEKKYPVKEYIVWRCPDGTILFDWDGNTWKMGIPSIRKAAAWSWSAECARAAPIFLRWPPA